MQTVNLDSAAYEELLRCLSVMKDICQDVDIRSGFIRQRTNDKASVFEFDLNPLIQDLSIPIVNIKQKIDLLKIFSEQEVEITVHDPDDDHANGFFTISDEFTTIKFDGAELDFMDNKYITIDERDGIFPMNEEDIILSTDIPNKMSDRIRIIAQSFNVNATQVIFDGETASINITTQSREQSAKVVSDLTTEKVLNCVSSLVITPFIIDHDGDTEFKMFNYRDNICSNKFATSISDIQINIYTRSSLIEDEE